MIALLWIWVIVSGTAGLTAVLAVIRLRGWWTNKITRLLVVFFVGVAIYSAISVFLSGSALGGPRDRIDRPLSDPALWGVELLTFGQLCMLIPAILLALQMLDLFQSPRKTPDDQVQL